MGVLLTLTAAVLGGLLALRGRGVIRHPDGSVEEYDERGPSHDVVKWGGIVSLTALSFYGVGLGLGLGGGTGVATGSGGGFSYGAPNTPTGSVVVIDTSNVYFVASAFAGSGNDTQDSVRFAITRLGADTTSILTEVKTATTTNARDTIVDNTNLKADTIYRGWFKYSAANGKWSRWSAPDTFVNSALVENPAIDRAYDWATATGRTNNAVLDGGQLSFTGYLDSIGTHMGVWPRADSLPSAPSSWPTNMVRHLHGGTSFAKLIDTEALTVPAVGDSVYYRVLFHWSWTCGSVGTDHGFQSNIGDLNQYFHRICETSTTMHVGLGANDFTDGNSYTKEITSAGYYRIEWGFKRTSSTAVKVLGVWIYNDATGALLYDWDDFRHRGNNNVLSADNPTITPSTMNAMFAEYLMGSSQSGGTGICCEWFGGFAHASNAPVGPYVAGEGP